MDELEQTLKRDITDERLRRNILSVIGEHSIYNEQHVSEYENPEGKIVSIYAFGSSETGESNSSSDIDLTVVFREKYLAVKHSREGIQNSLVGFAEPGIELWLANERQYKNPGKYMKGEPPVFHDIEGQDELCGTLMFNQHIKNAGPAYAGKEPSEVIEGPLGRVDSLDGYEYITVVEKGLARGLLGRDSNLDIAQRKEKDNNIAKSVLRMFHGLHVLTGGNTVDTYEEMRNLVQKGEFLERVGKYFPEGNMSAEQLVDLADECYVIKTSEETFGDWRWEGNFSVMNTENFSRFFNFLNFTRSAAFTEAFKQGYFWDSKRLAKMEAHKLRTSHSLVNLIYEDMHTFLPIATPFVGDIVYYLVNGPSQKGLLPTGEAEATIKHAKDMLLSIVGPGLNRNILMDLKKEAIAGLPTGSLKIGQIYSSSGSLTRALDSINSTEKLIRENKSLEAELFIGELKLERARAYFQRGELDEGWASLSESLQINPFNLGIHRLMTALELGSVLEDQIIINQKEFIGKIADYQSDSADRLQVMLSGLLRKHVSKAPAEKLYSLLQVNRGLHRMLEQSETLDELIDDSDQVEFGGIKLSKIKNLSVDEFEPLYAQFCAEKLMRRLASMEQERFSGGRARMPVSKEDAKRTLKNRDFAMAAKLFTELLFDEEQRSNAIVWRQRGAAQEALGDYIGSGANYITALKLKEDLNSAKLGLRRVASKIRKKYATGESFLNLPTEIRREAFELSDSLDLEEEKKILSELDNLYYRLDNDGKADEEIESALRSLVEPLFGQGKLQQLKLRKFYEKVFDSIKEHAKLSATELPEIMFEGRFKSLMERFYSKIKE